MRSKRLLCIAFSKKLSPSLELPQKHSRVTTGLGLVDLTKPCSLCCLFFLSQEALSLLEPMTNDPVNYVRQGALIASAFVLVQHNDVTCPKVTLPYRLNAWFSTVIVVILWRFSTFDARIADAISSIKCCKCINYVCAIKRHRSDVGLMLVQRRRRWLNIDPTLDLCLCLLLNLTALDEHESCLTFLQ